MYIDYIWQEKSAEEDIASFEECVEVTTQC